MNDPAQPAIDLLHPSACLCAAMRHASRAITNAWDAALADSGLTGTQFTLLVKLRETGPVAIKTLASAIGIDRTTLSRTLRPLAMRGLIDERTGDDRRVKRISVTPRGAAALGQAEQTWASIQGATVTALGNTKTAEILTHLCELERAVETARRRRIGVTPPAL